ncbi:pentapeptide repeat-containing protein, partial [Nostoc calcicola FACHB-3891]|nr:pentapeptide repeat-containing protein [Nostoc calcicola FACHB-3891]
MVTIGTLQAIISAIVLLFVIAGTFTSAIAVAIVGIVVGRIGVALIGIVSTFTVIVSIVYASHLLNWDTSSFSNQFIIIFIFSIVPVVAFWFLSIYVGWRASIGDKKYDSVRKIAIAFAAIRGTSFYNADLTDAKLNQAILKNTDFRKANLTRTCFHQVKKLSSTRPGTSYLQYANLRQVLITGQGQEKNFDRLDLRGINFQKANLSDASFIAADLSDASFQDSDLSRAKLVQTQLDRTDFTGATLTGAYIQDWGITTDTKFDGVRCEYVYMRLPTKENPDPLRKPDNHKEVFADGEFGDFIQPIFDTLDLYHNQGVDPRAIAISFKQLAENHP